MPDPLSQRVPRSGARTPGGGGGPNVVITDDTGLADKLTWASTQLDVVGVADKLAWASTLTDDIGFADVLAVTAAAALTDRVGVRDTLVMPMSWGNVPRSGTPDTDPWGDAWTDATVGNTGINHGADTNLSFDGLAVGVKAVYMEFDFTRFAGFSGIGGSHTLTVTATNPSPAVAVVMTMSMYAQATRWFTESTITQANQPAHGAQVFGSGNGIPANSTITFAYVLADADLNALLGKWVLMVVNGASVTDSGSIRSRESATPPLWNFTVTR